jgi:hypothetical protein
MELFNNNSNKDEAAAAGLTALLMLAGFKGARNIPIAGAETVLSSLSKKGKLVKQVADNKTIVGIRGSYRKNADRPSIFDSTKVTNEAVRFPDMRNIHKTLRPTEKVLRNDSRNFYEEAVLSGNEEEIKRAMKLLELRGGWIEQPGDNAPAAAISRLNKGLSGGTARLKGNNRTTSIDLNDPQVLERMMSELSLSAKEAYDVITRANLLRRQRLIKDALNEESGPDASVIKKIRNKNTARNKFKEEFRKSVAVRPDIIDNLDKKAVKLSEDTGDSIDVARDKLQQAFAELSPTQKAKSNMEDLEEQIFNRINGVVETTDGQKQRALNILYGKTSIYDDRKALENSKKVINLYQGLAEKSSAPVLDTGVLRNILSSLPQSDAKQVIDRLYASPYVYKNLTDVVDDVLSKGQVRKVSKNLVGKKLTKRITGSKRKKINNFFLQGGVDMRTGL